MDKNKNFSILLIILILITLCIIAIPWDSIEKMKGGTLTQLFANDSQDVYLKSNVVITGGTGTQDNPYTIDLASNCYYDETNSTYVWANANQSNYKINDTISSKESCMSLNKEEEISNPQTGIKRINIIYILLTIPLFVIIMMLRKFKKFRN